MSELLVGAGLVALAVGAAFFAREISNGGGTGSGMASTDVGAIKPLRADDQPADMSGVIEYNGRKYSYSGYDITPLPREQVEELARTLDPEAYRITMKAGTEPAFCGDLLNNKEQGMYVCVLGGLPLFRAGTKFESGSGWPSFYEPYDPAHIVEREDRSHGMIRIEILDARSGAHLGHVFDDGPPPTGKRYCLNSAAMKFISDDEPTPAESQPALHIASFGGGCFWGVEDSFQKLNGVVDAMSGYQGGHLDNPTYRQVCSDNTGHAEVVRVMYDPKVISYDELLTHFFKVHDPTQLNRQGFDYGSQYRSVIFASNAEQIEQAKAHVQKLSEAGKFGGRKIVTQILPAPEFFPAEVYHQDYNARHGRSCSIGSDG